VKARDADPCRFCRLYAISVVGFAALLGAFTVGQFLLEQLVAPAGVAASFPLARSALRSLGVAASGSALLLSLVLWAHPLPPPRLQQDLRKILTRGLLVTLPGFVVAALVAAAVGALVALASGRAASFAFTLTDVLAGALLAVIDAGLIVFLSARFLPRLSSARLSLPGKLVIVLTASVALRAVFGLLAGSALSG
jgi:hypothetical protein